jgi:hypothetical protein
MKASLCLLALGVSLLAQDKPDKFEYWPGASYDPTVPTEKQVAGHDPGDRVTRPEDIVKYMEALAAARPHQMRVFDYGKTWEGFVGSQHQAFGRDPRRNETTGRPPQDIRF